MRYIAQNLDLPNNSDLKSDQKTTDLVPGTTPRVLGVRERAGTLEQPTPGVRVVKTGFSCLRALPGRGGHHPVAVVAHGSVIPVPDTTRQAGGHQWSTAPLILSPGCARVVKTVPNAIPAVSAEIRKLHGQELN